MGSGMDLSTQSLPCPRRWPRKPRRPPCPKRPFVDAGGGKHSIGDFKGQYVPVQSVGDLVRALRRPNCRRW